MKLKIARWASIVKVVFDIEAANTESAIRQKLIEMGWTPPLDAHDALARTEVARIEAKIKDLKVQDNG